MHPLELWLVRHGETPSSRDGILAGWADVPLTEKGVAQAEAVRPELAGERFEGVWCSDLQRTIETARIAWGTATADRRLREINFGALEGMSWEALDPSHKRALIDFEDFNPPGGETLDQARERVAGFLVELSPGRHLIFTHGGVIRILTRQAGFDVFVPTGTVVALDWSHHTVLFKRESTIPVDSPFAT